MAPSIPLVAALFRFADASLDEQSMLQMPMVEQSIATEEDNSDCRCPGYFQEQCEENESQGCRWTSEDLGQHRLGWTDRGNSNEPWCQCDPDFAAPPVIPQPAPTLPPPPPVPAQAPAAICPAGWEQKGDIGADIGGCGLQSCGERYDITSEAACATRCDGNEDCVGFSYAPMNGDRNHAGVTACTIYNSDTPTGTWTGTEGIPTQVFCGRLPVVPFAGRWVDPAGGFYGGAVIRLGTWGSVCSVENPDGEAWQTSSYECAETDGQWDFIETRAADGATHAHRMVLQDNGSLRVTKGDAHEWTLLPENFATHPSTVNVALNKPVTMSSYGHWGPREHATDGVTCNAYTDECGTAHTENDMNAWIDVDLQQDAVLTAVTLWNGWEHCCRERINPFVVIFFDGAGAELARTDPLEMDPAEVHESMDIAVPTSSPVRRVRVQLDGHQNYLHLAEIQAFSEVNLALNKPVTASSENTEPHYGALMHATDGILCNANTEECGTAHTESEANAWLNVDLEQDVVLSRVELWNGWEHCCRERINPFVVLFLDSAGAEVARTQSLEMNPDVVHEAMEIAVPTDAPVRHVRVQLDNHVNYLHLAEIRAFA